MECRQLARAQSLLLRRTDQSKKILQEIEESLGLSGEVRCLKGRVALREGRLTEAFGWLAPQGNVWFDEPSPLWELAIVAAALQNDVVAIEAYERLLQTNRLEQRERVAARLELAVVLSRGNAEQRRLARLLVAEVAPRELDPDSRPWVFGVRRYLNELEERGGAPLDAVTLRYFFRYQQSAKGELELYGQLVGNERWLHLSPNEGFAVVALAMTCQDRKAAARLWSAISEPTESLARLKRRAQAAQCNGGSDGDLSAKAAFAPSPS